MTALLPCLRCGDPYDPAETFSDERCDGCESKLTRLLVWRGPAAMWRAVARYRKNMARHPTYETLSAALDAMESVPPGTLTVPLPSVPD